MLDFSVLQYILLFIFIAISGFIDSIAGGGGLISIPVYMSMGVPPHLILGTNKCVSTAGGLLAVSRYIKSGKINFKVMTFGIIGGLLGSTAGANLSSVLDSQKMSYLLIILVPLVMALSFYKNKLVRHVNFELRYSQQIFRCFIIGLVIGGYDGFFGPGTGSFLIVALVLFMNMEMGQASANARVINFTSNISAFFVFLVKGLILWEITFIAIFASLIGNYFGSNYVIKGNVSFIKKVFNFALLTLLVKSIYDVSVM